MGPHGRNQAALDGIEQVKAAKDHGRIELDGIGAGLEFGQSRLRRMDAADPDNGQMANALAHLGQLLRRQIEKRFAGEAAGFVSIFLPGHAVAADGGVGDDQAVEIGRQHHPGNDVECGLVEIGRDLEKDRDPGFGLGARGQQFPEQAAQRLIGLQVA